MSKGYNRSLAGRNARHSSGNDSSGCDERKGTIMNPLAGARTVLEIKERRLELQHLDDVSHTGDTLFDLATSDVVVASTEVAKAGRHLGQ